MASQGDALVRALAESQARSDQIEAALRARLTERDEHIAQLEATVVDLRERLGPPPDPEPGSTRDAPPTEPGA